MKNSKNHNTKPARNRKTDTITEPGDGIIVVASGSEPGIYRFASPAQRKMILRDNAENRCREFRTEEYSKAEEYLERVLDEAEARKYPLGYIAVRSGQFRGVYPYITAEERLKHMNKYHKYEIRDFNHFHFRKMAEIWSEGISYEDTADRHSFEHKHLKNIFDTGNPASFSGKVSSIERCSITFDELEIRLGNNTVLEKNITVYNTDAAQCLETNQEIHFKAEVYEYITDQGFNEYGIYGIFDLQI